MGRRKENLAVWGNFRERGGRGTPQKRGGKGHLKEFRKTPPNLKHLSSRFFGGGSLKKKVCWEKKMSGEPTKKKKAHWEKGQAPEKKKNKLKGLVFSGGKKIGRQ